MFYCQRCRNYVDSYVKKDTIWFNIKNQRYYLNANRRFCAECNNFLYDSSLEKNLSKKIIEAKEKLFGVEVNKILKFRRKYHISRYQLAIILGCSNKIIIKYEHYLIMPNEYILIKIKTLLKNPFLLYVLNLPK